MAGYEASTARRFFSAMRNGSRCVETHKKVLKLKPDYYDAYLSVGVYDYMVGRLPFAYKALATMTGFRGNKQRGITGCKRSSKRMPRQPMMLASSCWPSFRMRNDIKTCTACSDNSVRNIPTAICSNSRWHRRSSCSSGRKMPTPPSKAC